jgi:Protein of unknown function (DUF3800)
VIRLYFDESGEFLRDGTLRRLTLGGCAATVESWGSFNGKWRAALDAEGVGTFHMTYLEASEKEFRGWDRDRKDNLLDKLLSIMNEHIPIYTGFANYPFRMRERKLTRASIDRLIARSFIKCAGELDWGLDEGELDDGVSIVFARHPEFSEVNVIKYFNTINKDETLKSCSVASPHDVLPLQAADLFAYEMMQHGKHFRTKEPERPAFKRLLESAKYFQLHVQLNARHPLSDDE